MAHCSSCNKKFGILEKKHPAYPGKKSGSFEITDETLVCEGCLTHANEKFSEIKRIFEQGRNTTALTLIEKNLNEKSCEDLVMKAEILNRMKREKEALACCDTALLIDTHYAKAWYHKAWALIKLSKLKESKKALENVLALEGDLNRRWIPPAILSLAVVELQLKNKDAAGDHFAQLYQIVNSKIIAEDFARYCVDNWPVLLHQLEQPDVPEKSVVGVAH